MSGTGDRKAVLPSRRSTPRGAESGASAVEFAFILPVLLAMLYGTFVYGYVFVLYQSVNFAAQEGARAAVAAQLNNSAQQKLNATTTAGTDTGVMSFLPADQKTMVSVNTTTGPDASGVNSITVTVSMNLDKLFVPLPIPFISTGFPPLPAALTGTATGLLN